MLALSEKEIMWMQRPFYEDEILGVIKDCNGNKAHNQDSFAMKFYKECLGTIKTDLILAINHFYSQGRFEKSLNASYIALIPKKNDARELKDYRPISVTGSFYKVLSKLLANRFRPAMGKLVSSSQMSFVRGRQIVDTSLIVNEFLDSRPKQGRSGVLCKLDIEKAFDNVHWDFLLNMLRIMVFQ